MTSRRRPPAPRRSRLGHASDDERGSMAILLMVMLVGLAVSALLVPMIITQDRTTRFDSTRVQALDAAQAGIDVTLGTIRAAVTSAIGDSSKLPCGPLSGPVTGNGVAAYAVVIEYFAVDPVNEPYPSAGAMKCVPGYGTFDPASGTTTPGFARFTSTGTVGTVGNATNGSTGGRTVTATYTFRTSNVNVLGGVVQIAGSGSLCIDVGSAPAVGTAARIQPCSASTPPAAQQVFAYRSDLTLQLTSSITAANPTGLCLNSAAIPAVSGTAVQLSLCGPLGLPASYTQQWSYNDNGQYQAALSTSATTGLGALANLCMTVATQAAGQPISLTACGSAANWIPSASVGPGAAALPQWVNFNEFGRCLDVTNQDPGHAFLIDYPCKQNPYPGAVTWNQLFQAAAIPAGQAFVTGQLYTNDTANGQRYCLTSPGSSGSYVTVKTCTGSALQSWTIYGGDKSLTYSTKYTIVSGSLCLGLSAPNAEVPAWSTIDVETCTGTTEQKWNAVPNILNSTLKNIHEH